MSANTNSDQVCNIHETCFRAPTEWDERKQIVKRGPGEVSTMFRNEMRVCRLNVLVKQRSAGKLEL